MAQTFFRAKILLILLCTYSSTSSSHDVHTLFQATQKIYSKHGNTLYRGAIWGIDTIYLLGKLFPNKVPQHLTTSSFTALNYAGLLYLGSQYDHMRQQARNVSLALERNKEIACLTALAESLCAAFSIVDALANAFAATQTIRGKTKTATSIYKTMIPFADMTLIITILLDVFRLSQNNANARAIGISGLALRGLGYWSMAICRHNPNSLKQACCYWSMATLYGIQSIMLDI